MTSPVALIFDIDGTLADTEPVHLEAFNEAFAEEGIGWQWDRELYRRLLLVSGGKERIAAYSTELNGTALPEAIIARVHAAKTRAYTKRVAAGRVRMRPGMLRLIHQAIGRNIPLALATTTTPANIEALLSTGPLGPKWRTLFVAVADASTAPLKKPDPQAYLQVLKSLNRPANTCVAFEDSANGLRAARAAGLPTIVTPTAFTVGQDFTGALAVLPDIDTTHIDELVELIYATH